MLRSLMGRTLWLEALYFCRAIFHDEIFQGGSLPFFQKISYKQ
ncbi:MAG TPA: RAxF-45 family protein [Pseudoneobacillus sp.]|nr:RAxF-45 family protein [Pseudoneobacillus sp.]